MFTVLTMQIHCIYRKEYMYYLNVSCVIEAQNMVHFRIVLKITSFYSACQIKSYIDVWSQEPSTHVA